jgi:4-hydroxy-3-polyprenylbenzoate decarboxylase
MNHVIRGLYLQYHSLKSCINDLAANGHLIKIKEAVDPHLEMAEIHRRVFEANGPAVYYENVNGSPFPAVSNLFGTIERSRFIFRNKLEQLKTVFSLKANPKSLLNAPLKNIYSALAIGIHTIPKKVSSGPILYRKTTIDQLPQIKSWPDDGGPFILLPQVYTEDVALPGWRHSNLGMYRVQLAGNDYIPNQEIGLHYQIRRDIGIHHQKAILNNQPLRVSVFIGGPPSSTFAAVMFLPEDLPEIAFAGALGGRRFRYLKTKGHTLAADADFCITGTIIPNQVKPEGPFGDHLGYYSLKHNYPVMKVEDVYHREDAVWPFTIVGRPPQEDSSLGALIQEIGAPMIPSELPGIKAVHAVDATGVHPLMLAIGSERYLPYEKRRPQELLTLGNAILGYGPCTLSKYLFIVAGEDNPTLDIHDIKAYFIHMLERVNWQTDLHFQTNVTMDSLDYSGTALHEGSKLMIAAAGDIKRHLATTINHQFTLPDHFSIAKCVMPGIIAIEAKSFATYNNAVTEMKELSDTLAKIDNIDTMPLIVIVDDANFTAQSLNNFLWITFTRSNPSHDIYGINTTMTFKHFSCEKSLIIDCRIKPHHAPPLIEDKATTEKVNNLATPGNPLHGII